VLVNLLPLLPPRLPPLLLLLLVVVVVVVAVAQPGRRSVPLLLLLLHDICQNICGCNAAAKQHWVPPHAAAGLQELAAAAGSAAICCHM
jgi:hypothetical protein